MSIREKILSICTEETKAEQDGSKYIKWYEENVLKAYSFPMAIPLASIFATYVGMTGGLTNKDFPVTANCDEGMNWFKNRKQWEYGLAYKGTYTPRPGDMVYYSSKYNQVDSDNVGWCIGCDGNIITVLEGGKDGKVKERYIYLSNYYILGFGCINYPDEAFPVLPMSPLAGTGIGTAVALETMVVRTGNANSFMVVGKLPKGKSVEVLGMTENNWLKVVWGITESGYAYIDNTKPYFQVTWKEKSYIAKEFAVGVVIEYIGGKCYSSPDSNNPKECSSGKAKIAQYAKGSSHPYYLIATDESSSNVYGWVDAEGISSLSQSNYIAWVGKVTASVLNVRTGPGTWNGKLQSWPQLAKDNLILVIGEVIDEEGDVWYYVDIHGNRGYVCKEFITIA